MFSFPLKETSCRDPPQTSLLIDLSPPRFARGAVVVRQETAATAASSTKASRSYTLRTLTTTTPILTPPNNKLFAQVKWDDSASPRESRLRESLGDVNLITLQVCRASLLVAAAVAFVASLGATVPNNLRLACAASGAACVLSMRFYTRLITLRRLPDCLGYRLESNEVAFAMRVANWTVVVAMLTWSALLLRGPYETPSTTSGMILLHLRYAQWRTVGPLLMGMTSLLVIPVWHLFGLVQLSTGTRCQRISWVLLALLCIVIIALVSTDVYAGIIEPSQACSPNCSKVQRDQLDFVILSCSLWFGYSVLGVLRGIVRVGNACMPLLRDADALKSFGLNDERAERAATQATLVYHGSLGNCMHRAAQMGRHMYLGFATLSIRTYDANAMQRLAAWAEFGGPLPQTDHRRIVKDMDDLNDIEDTVYDQHTEQRTLIRPNSSQLGSPSDGPLANYRKFHTQLLQTNDPELTQVCTQIFDSLLALLDVGTQALVAFGYATLTSVE